MTEGFLGHAPLEEARSQLRATGPGVGQREERREAEKTDKESRTPALRPVPSPPPPPASPHLHTCIKHAHSSVPALGSPFWVGQTNLCKNWRDLILNLNILKLKI